MRDGAKTGKIALLFGFLIIGFLFFLFATYHTVISDRRLPSLVASKKESAIRGEVYSKDGFVLASSKKLYKAMVNTYNIDPKKEDLFINLFSIYSGTTKDEIRELLKSQKGSVVLSYNLDEKSAKSLRKLSLKLNRMGIFVFYEDKSSGRTFRHGLSIVESGEKREYLYGDSLSPILGYVRKKDRQGFTSIEGVKGVESYYDYRLGPLSDGYIEGQRDVGSDIILNKQSIIKEKVDGLNIHLNVYLKLQKKIERVVDRYHKRLKTKEIVAAIMDSQSGKILAVATTNRFNPNSIKVEDYPYLNATFSEYPFEPGSVIKPIVYALLIEKNLINPIETIELHKGRYRLKNKIITDSHPLDRGVLEDVIIYSSNIGIAKLAQLLTPQDYYEGLLRFGYAKISEVDLPYEKRGVIPTANMLRDEIYKATVAYGYGMTSTVVQILNSYNVFNNGGYLLRPAIASIIEDRNSNKYLLDSNPKRDRIISQTTANSVKNTLIKTVQKGTAKGARVEGVEVGGKTGTAHIAQGGEYINMYNSSFFGFANDKSSKFTIGVAIFEPTAKNEYFASQTAVPVFKEIVELLLDDGFLKRDVVEQEDFLDSKAE